MRPQELMIGDLIMASVYEEEIDDDVYHPARIMALSSISELFDGNYSIDWLDDCASESCGDIEPIPLTEEILKANGFILKGKTSVEDNDIYYCVYVDADNKAYEIHYRTCDGQLRIFWKNYLFGITYVHELQHALRLCGLTEMADNFKIK